jgi:hypothetical protein
VEAETLALRTPKLLHSYGDRVIVSGLADGERLLDQRLPGAHLGMPVQLSR